MTTHSELRSELNSSRTVSDRGALDDPSADVLFALPTRRRDGERPLGIAAGLVGLLTLYMGFSSLHLHDWRPVSFYLGFSGAAITACVLLWLQWSNERLVAQGSGLTHYDWLKRPTHYLWADVVSAVEKPRPDNTRFILQVNSARNFVLHGDEPGYIAAVHACRERLEKAGVGVNTE
jgi:hypothetical protein